MLSNFNWGFLLGMIFTWNIFAALFIISIIDGRKQQRREQYESDW